MFVRSPLGIRGALAGLLGAGLFLVSLPAFAWTSLAGSNWPSGGPAEDVHGVVWDGGEFYFLDTAETGGGFNYWYYEGLDGWEGPSGGNGVQISVDGQGVPWVIVGGAIAYFSGGSWSHLNFYLGPDFSWVSAGEPSLYGHDLDMIALNTSGAPYLIVDAESGSPGYLTLPGFTGATFSQVAMFPLTTTCTYGTSTITIHHPWAIDANHNIYRYSVGTTCTNGSWTQDPYSTGQKAQYITSGAVLGVSMPYPNVQVLNTDTHTWTDKGHPASVTLVGIGAGLTSASCTNTTCVPSLGGWDGSDNAYYLN